VCGGRGAVYLGSRDAVGDNKSKHIGRGLGGERKSQG
jgi:hypothetical protein